MIDSTQTLGDLATAHPSATAVFLRHRLDFCCGGRQKLEDACRAAGIEPERVLAEIEAQSSPDEEPDKWSARPLPELIDHILTRYHETLRDELPPLIEAAKRVERVHAAKPACPLGLSALLEQVHTELCDHMRKEELVLFPAVVAGHRGSSVHMPIRVMMQEHDDHGVSLQRIRELTSDLVPPSGACGTWRGLYTGLEKLEADLMRHIHLEGNILFPRALSEEKPTRRMGRDGEA